MKGNAKLCTFIIKFTWTVLPYLHDLILPLWSSRDIKRQQKVIKAQLLEK